MNRPYAIRSHFFRPFINRRCARALRTYITMSAGYSFTLEIRTRTQPVLGGVA